jgi:hypothetical protein
MTELACPLRRLKASTMKPNRGMKTTIQGAQSTMRSSANMVVA